MGKTTIEWCDFTFNSWIGCSKVSPGCANCYAATQDAFRKWTPQGWGRGKPRRRTSIANWREPVKWDREAGEILAAYNREVQGSFGHLDEMMDEPRRPRVFCASLADWLDDEVPIEWLADLLDLIRRTPNLDWLLLTKRPQNWRKRLSDWGDYSPPTETQGLAYDWLQGMPPSNVWIGTTAEDQERADERIPHLLSIPARVRFLSCEPLLGPVNLDLGAPRYRTAESYHAEIHWVICGGESGPGARPMHMDWALSLRDQCRSAGAAFFMKQMGGLRKPFAEIPAELNVRQFPAIA